MRVLLMTASLMTLACVACSCGPATPTTGKMAPALPRAESIVLGPTPIGCGLNQPITIVDLRITFVVFKENCLLFNIKNTSPAHIVEWNGWAEKGEMRDEHGNKYKPYERSGGIGLVDLTKSQEGSLTYSLDQATRLHPGKEYNRMIRFGTIADVAKEFFISLPPPFPGASGVEVRGVIKRK